MRKNNDYCCFYYVKLHINIEQIFTEKLKSLLRFRIASTRYKDIFDFYYLINDKDFNKEKCLNYINKLIFSDNSLGVNDISNLYKILDRTLNNTQFKNMLKQANNNWLGLSIDDVINSILNFIENLEIVTI